MVADELTAAALTPEARLLHITPWNCYFHLKLNKPDVLLVESAWSGWRNRWKYGIAAYPDHPERNNLKLRYLVARARDMGIPTVFWNKEDGIHFDRFINSACLFDVVLTVDETCLPRYRERLGPNVKLGVLPFAVQPVLHHPVPQATSLRRANFVGSYSHHIHDRRREWQDMMFRAAEPLGLTVYDRNSGRKATHYRYPDLPWMDVKRSVPYEATADIYRQHMVSLNVNTVENSPTMFSRRLIEIVACGGLAVTNPSPAVNRFFKEYVEVVQNEEECREVLGRIARDGLTKRDRDRALAGADYVMKHHTWAHRLKQIMDMVA